MRTWTAPLPAGVPCGGSGTDAARARTRRTHAVPAARPAGRAGPALARPPRQGRGAAGAPPVVNRNGRGRVSEPDVWSMAEREESAGRVLHANRERRRSRRSPDTFFGAPEGLLAGS